MSSAITEHKIKIAQVVRGLLLADSEIVNLIENKVLPIVAPSGTKGDFITYKRFAYSQEFASKMGLTSETCMIQVECISDDFDRSLDIGYAVCKSIVGRYSNPNMQISIEDSDEDFKDGKYYQIFLFRVE
ncbi:MAG: DUF3168 domain-containing protein [Bacteroides xylanisolvens]